MLCHRCQGNKCDLALLYQDEYQFYTILCILRLLLWVGGGGGILYPSTKYTIFTFFSHFDPLRII